MFRVKGEKNHWNNFNRFLGIVDLNGLDDFNVISIWYPLWWCHRGYTSTLSSRKSVSRLRLHFLGGHKNQEPLRGTGRFETMKKMCKKKCESLGFHIEMAISYRKIPAIYSVPSAPRVTHPRHPLHQSIRFCSKRIPGRCHRWFPLMSTNFCWGFPRTWPTSYGLASVCLSNIRCFLLKSKFINFPQHHLKKAGPNFKSHRAITTNFIKSIRSSKHPRKKKKRFTLELLLSAHQTV